MNKIKLYILFYSIKSKTKKTGKNPKKYRITYNQKRK